MSKKTSAKSQRQRFEEAAQEAGADMTKEEFGRVIGGLARPRPKSDAEKVSKTEVKDDA